MKLLKNILQLSVFVKFMEFLKEVRLGLASMHLLFFQPEDMRNLCLNFYESHATDTLCL